MKLTIVVILFYLSFIVTITAIGQEESENKASSETVMKRAVVNGDTIYFTNLEEVFVVSKTFKNRYEKWKYYRLVKNVKKAYPWAKLAKRKYDEVIARMEKMDTEKEKKKFIKQIEQEILDEYEEDLKSLTITQGRILIKLIDREIGSTSYDVLKDFRGTFTAFFWQTLARIFGSNLKTEFDAKGQDKLIDEIVILIDQGVL